LDGSKDIQSNVLLNKKQRADIRSEYKIEEEPVKKKSVIVIDNPKPVLTEKPEQVVISDEGIPESYDDIQQYEDAVEEEDDDEIYLDL